MAEEGELSSPDEMETSKWFSFDEVIKNANDARRCVSSCVIYA